MDDRKKRKEEEEKEKMEQLEAPNPKNPKQYWGKAPERSDPVEPPPTSLTHPRYRPLL